jgi:SPP1 gp7 family putative phage head morphogenesis protein
MTTWDVTAKHERFEEAADWFRSRVPYTHAELGELDDKQRARAFWVAGGLELSATQTIFDEIAKALENGSSLADFKKGIREKLGDKFGVTGYQLETVFRNWTQTAYNTGRWYQLTDPEAAVGRPWLLYDAVLDARTTALCESLNNTVKRVDDPWWLTHWPPLHHRCRSSVRGITRSEAAKRGVTEGTPDAQVPDGFGLAPPLRGDAPPQPDLAGVDPNVATAYKVREEKLRLELEEAQRRAQEARRLETPAHWLDTEYREKYGENAGRAVAWGRAMEERGKGVSLAEAKRQHVELTENIGLTTHANATPLFTSLRQAEEDGFIPKGLKTLGAVAEALGEAVAKTPSLKRTLAEVRALAGLIGHRAGIQPAGKQVVLGAPRISRVAPAQIKRDAPGIVDKVQAFWAELSDRSLVLADKRRGYVISWWTNRGKFDAAARVVYVDWIERAGTLHDDGHGTLVHEMGHGVEHHNERGRLNAEQFLERRTIGEFGRSLRKLMPRHGFRADEITKEDRFFDAYMGKQYIDRGGRRFATEVTSMALQEMHQDTANLVDKDEESFWFALGQLAGESAK